MKQFFLKCFKIIISNAAGVLGSAIGGAIGALTLAFLGPIGAIICIILGGFGGAVGLDWITSKMMSMCE